MDLNILMALTLGGMLIAIFAGVHIALALGLTAMVGTYFIFEDWYLASAQVGGAAYELVRHYVFATIPLFVLMGDFVAKCRRRRRSLQGDQPLPSPHPRAPGGRDRHRQRRLRRGDRNLDRLGPPPSAGSPIPK